MLSRCRTAIVYLIATAVCGVALSACTSSPVEETVTTAASRSARLPANGAQPVAITPNLPVRDADIETAGDRIAEAITHLEKTRHGSHVAALRALGQAEAAMTRALRVKARDERANRALHAALRNIQSAERTVQRGGSSDASATRQLATLNKDLDELTLQTQPDTVEASPDDQTQLP